MATIKIIILQGLPGSGKSYHAARIAEEEDALIVSADIFAGLYTEDPDGGPPSFDVTKLGDAHGACLRHCIGAVQDAGSVVVDNTNTTPLEVAPYVAVAQAFGCEPKLVLVDCGTEKAFARQKHGIPREGFDAMCERLAQFDPAPHWQFIPGWHCRVISN